MHVSLKFRFCSTEALGGTIDRLRGTLLPYIFNRHGMQRRVVEGAIGLADRPG